MNGITGYIWRVICGAVICGICQAMAQKLSFQKWMQPVLGLFMALVLLQPLSGLGLRDWEVSLPEALESGVWTEAGRKMAEEETDKRIKQQLEAYVLEKGKALGAELEVRLTLDESGCPAQIRIRGDWSPYARDRLEQILESDLGILKENQIWHG